MASNNKEVQRKADAKRAGTRARAWTAIVYPTSAPDNWQEILAEQLVECLISPLHDKDKDLLDAGEDISNIPPERIVREGDLIYKIKDPHWHVVLSFKNPTGFDKAKEVFQAINAVVPPENQCKVKDFKQMARYLCHLDQPNKHRYNIHDVVTFGSIEYPALVMTSADEDEILDQICDFIDEHCITSFAAFCRFVRNEKQEWRNIVYHKSSYFIREYIKSVTWELNKDA